MRAVAIAMAAAAMLAGGCDHSIKMARMNPALLIPGKTALVKVAESPRQWTGVAVSHSGRIFINFPRWSDDVPVSVAELRPAGRPGFSLQRPPLEPVAFPNESWQQWRNGADPTNTFVCVQSVVVDDDDCLWVVDAGAPQMGDIVPQAPKLVKIDLKANQVVRTYPFESPAVETRSYLNDVRVDTKWQVAYLTDSGTGAILVVNLQSGKIRRVLDHDPSTKSEHVVPVIDNKPWLKDGKPADIHSDGIALSADHAWLYYHALTGRTLYRVPTAALLDEQLSPEDLHRQVENLGRTGNCDGMEYDGDGRLFLTQIEANAVTRFVPGGANRIEYLAQSPALAWPDSFAIGPDGALYVTASQIHLQPNPPRPYQLFKIVPTR